MLIYMGLLSIFLLILTDMFTSVLNIFAQTETTSSLEQDSRFITSRLAYDIQRAGSITTPAFGNTQNSLTIVVNSQNFTYSLTGNDLILTNNSGSYAINSNQTKISNLNFTRLGNVGGKNSLKIQFTLTGTRQESKGVRSTNYQTTLNLR
jgi:hypothetical protein